MQSVTGILILARVKTAFKEDEYERRGILNSEFWMTNRSTQKRSTVPDLNIESGWKGSATFDIRSIRLELERITAKHYDKRRIWIV